MNDNAKSTSISRGTIAAAVDSDYCAMLDGMKGIEVLAAKVGAIEGIEGMTPGQLYDETYRRVLIGTIKELELRLEEFK